MRNLRVAGSALQAQGLILVIGCLALSPGFLDLGNGRVILFSASIFLFLFIYGIALLKVGTEVFRANPKYKKWAYLFGLLCVFTKPLGLIFGIIALLFLIKGRNAYARV